jgi:hypothetical protein
MAAADGNSTVVKKPTPVIHTDTNLTRKTDTKSGYKHGQFPNKKKPTGR